MEIQRRTRKVLDVRRHAPVYTHNWANRMESAQGHGQEIHWELRGRGAAPHLVLGEVQGRLPGGGAPTLRLAGWRSVGVKSMKNFQVEERT